MNEIDLIPDDPLTKRLVVDLLYAMFKHELATNRAAAMSEFPRPDIATADTQSEQADLQSDSTTVTLSGQNEYERVKL